MIGEAARALAAVDAAAVEIALAALKQAHALGDEAGVPPRDHDSRGGVRPGIDARAAGRRKRGRLRPKERTMTPFEVATLATSVAIGLGQIGIVGYAIRAMTLSTRDRADEHDRRYAEAMTAEDKRHTEMMAALDIQRVALETLIVGTGQRQPAS